MVGYPLILQCLTLATSLKVSLKFYRMMALVFHFGKLLQILQTAKCKEVSFLGFGCFFFNLKTSVATLILCFKSNKLESFVVVVLSVVYVKDKELGP